MIAVLLATACTEPDSDGPRWTSPSDTWWEVDTDPPTPPPPTGPTGDTAPPPGPTGDTGSGTWTGISCDGEGPGVLTLGSGTRTDFEAYQPNDRLPVVIGQPSGEWGVTVSVLSEGLDTGDDMDVVLRMITDDFDTTYIGVLLLQCNTPGPGWVSFHADFEDEFQGNAAAGGFDGDDIRLELTLTDHTDESANVDLDLILDGP